MEVFGIPVVIFVALCLLVLMLGASLYLTRVKALLLEQKVEGLQSSAQQALDALQNSVNTLAEKNAADNADRLAGMATATLDAIRNSQNVLVDQLQSATSTISSAQQDMLKQVLNSAEATRNDVLACISKSDERSLDATKKLSEHLQKLSDLIVKSDQESRVNIEDQTKTICAELVKYEKSVLEGLSVASEKASSNYLSCNEKISDMQQGLSDHIDSVATQQTQSIVGDIAAANKRLDDNLHASNDRLIDVVNLVRISNTISETKKQHDEGRIVIENESFVKTFDGCQLVQIEDKSTGQVTKNEFEKGQISTSKTYRTDSLEYVGHYENGVLQSMEDVTSPNGDVTLYEYDEAGEIESIK